MMYEKPTNRFVDRCFIHCSASDARGPAYQGEQIVSTIKRWHVEGNGWSDIGYHFVMDYWGDVFAGRALTKSPAAQRGNNQGTIAICVHGLTVFSQDQFISLRLWCAMVNQAHSGRISFHGHCEVSNKSCPVFDYSGVLQLDRFGRIK